MWLSAAAVHVMRTGVLCVQVMEGLRRGQAVDADLATPGMATAHLMGDYAMSATVSRTSVRTPAVAHDKVAAEAATQAHAMRLQTPLLGEASTSSMVEGQEPESAGAGPSVGATPNPMATAPATPGRGVGATTGAGATPLAAGDSAAGTPMRDALGINTPGGGTPLPGRRAERARLRGIREGVKLGLGQLPQPHNEFQLAGGADSDAAGAAEDEALAEEDGADAAGAAAARKRRRKSARMLAALDCPAS